MKKVAIIRRNGLGDFIAGTVPLCNYLVEKYNGNVKFIFFMSSRNIGIARYFFPDALFQMAISIIHILLLP